MKEWDYTVTQADLTFDNGYASPICVPDENGIGTDPHRFPSPDGRWELVQAVQSGSAVAWYWKRPRS